jgi:hypothetical protein
MNVHILRSPEYSLDNFNEVVNLLKTYTNSIKIKGYSKQEISYLNEDDVKHWDEFFQICNKFRIENRINNDDYVFLLTEYQNNEDYFGWTDEKLGNYFIQTSNWNQYFESEVNKHFPISYEVVAWILRSLMYDTQEDLLENAHIRAKGCVMDFCDEKEDIIIKMRTGDVCQTCLSRINLRGVNPAFLGNIFNTMENIRKGLMYRERNKSLGIVSPIRIQLGKNRPKFVFTEMNNIELKIGDDETSIYMFLLKNKKIVINNLPNYIDEIKECYYLVKNGNKNKRDIQKDVEFWLDEDKDSITPKPFKPIIEKVSNINREIKKLLGPNLSQDYLICNVNRTYFVKINRDLVEIKK